MGGMLAPKFNNMHKYFYTLTVQFFIVVTLQYTQKVEIQEYSITFRFGLGLGLNSVLSILTFQYTKASHEIFMSRNGGRGGGRVVDFDIFKGSTLHNESNIKHWCTKHIKH